MKEFTVEKRFLDEETLIQDSFKLAVKVFESGFRPTFTVGLWRGGSSVAIYVQECLQTLGVKTDHIALRTSYNGLPSYKDMIEKPEDIRVHGTQYLIENLNADDQLLIVDDAFSSGQNIQAVITRLKKNLKANMPKEIRIATLWRKPKQNKVSIEPDFFLHETNDWLVFPYELKGLTLEEINEHKPFVKKYINTKLITK
jgi:hypoxanthine phosphoribosyltransferase